MSPDQFEKLLSDLFEQVERKRVRAAEKYFESLDAAEWIEGQRCIGGQRALTELKRRFLSATGQRPEWAERLDPVGEFELRPMLTARANEPIRNVRIAKRRLA